MKMNKWITIAAAAVFSGLVVIGGIVLFREEIKDYINGARAQRLEERAKQAFSKEQWAEASRLGQAAFYLDADNKEIQLIVARSLLKQKMSSAVGWWRLAIDDPNLPVDELRYLTEALLRGDNVEETIFFLNRLLELDGENAETQKLWMDSLSRLRRHQTVAELAGRLVNEGSEDWTIHQTYLRSLQRRESGERNLLVIKHLQELLNQNQALSLDAARELVVVPEVDSATRLQAIQYLKENGVDELDMLYAKSAEARENQSDSSVLLPLLESILDEPEQGQASEMLNWALWMDALEWFLDRTDYDSFKANGGSPDAYFRALLREERYDEVKELTATIASSEEASELPVLLYRSAALEATGEKEEALETLQLAVETVDPDRSYQLEAALIQGGQWNLVSKLYDILLQDDPDDPKRLIKCIGANYYTGEQEASAPLLAKLELGAFEQFPDQENFLIYLKLLDKGYQQEIHQHLEALLVRYPEIFDFRLTLGFSYLLQGQQDIGEQMLSNMPELSLRAPRYIRVMAVILGENPENLMHPGEMDSLTPRERYLISLQEG